MEGGRVENEQTERITLQEAIRDLHSFLMPDATPKQLDESSRILAEAQTQYEIGTLMPDDLREEVTKQMRAVFHPEEQSAPTENQCH